MSFTRMLSMNPQAIGLEVAHDSQETGRGRRVRRDTRTAGEPGTGHPTPQIKGRAQNRCTPLGTSPHHKVSER
jgi:hypothetical protein